MQNTQPVHMEIEAKVSVPSLKPISHRLEEIGAAFLKTVQEEDVYLADADGHLLKRGCGLRLRLQTCDSEQIFYLTYKGPKLKKRYKTRSETEVQVSDYGAVMRLFCELGFTPSLQVNKKRRIWKLNECLICLDELPELGCFVEVEGPDEKQIEKTLDELGLSALPHISKGYARLTAEALRQNGKNTKEA